MWNFHAGFCESFRAVLKCAIMQASMQCLNTGFRCGIPMQVILCKFPSIFKIQILVCSLKSSSVEFSCSANMWVLCRVLFSV